MITRHHKYLSVIGWYGAVAAIVGYFLINFAGVEVHSPLFLYLNLSAILSIAFDSLRHKAYASTSINLIVATLTVVSIVKFLF